MMSHLQETHTAASNSLALRMLRVTVRGLDRLSLLTGRRSAAWMTGTDGVGRRGEEAAYFYLRRHGYVVVARRWRTATLRGDIDLVAWEGEQLCIVEVKTRSTRQLIAAEFAVDDAKERMLRRMAESYVRQMRRPGYRGNVRPRFDIMSVYLNGDAPEIEVRRGAFTG